MKITSGDLEKLSSFINMNKSMCRYELAFAMMDDRHPSWWLGAIDDLTSRGILHFDSKAHHPVIYYIESCMACGWNPVTSQSQHEDYYATMAKIRRHHFSPVMYVAES